MFQTTNPYQSHASSYPIARNSANALFAERERERERGCFASNYPFIERLFTTTISEQLFSDTNICAIHSKLDDMNTNRYKTEPKASARATNECVLHTEDCVLSSNESVLQTEDHVLDSKDCVSRTKDHVLYSEDCVLPTNDRVLASADRVLNSNDCVLQANERVFRYNSHKYNTLSVFFNQY